MTNDNFQLVAKDGAILYGRVWMPDPNRGDRKGVILILHGMGEHIGRYHAFADVLSQAGYVVVGYDQRGHGRTGAQSTAHGYLGPDGFRQIVRDAHQAVVYVKEEYLDLPVILFAHSMGSFVGQSYLLKHAQTISGAIFCGSNGPEGPILLVAAWLAKRYARRNGVYAESKLLTKLTFGRYNRSFKPNRTDFDWITSDVDALEAYLADPMCGFALSAASMHDMFQEMRTMHRKDDIRRIPTSLPIFLIAGEADPVGHHGKGVRKLQHIYQSRGLKNVSMKLYPRARHEILHETNRLLVYQDVLQWLHQISPRTTVLQ